MHLLKYHYDTTDPVQSELYCVLSQPNVDQRDASLVLGNGPAQPGCTTTCNNQAMSDPDRISSQKGEIVDKFSKSSDVLNLRIG